ncbi:MAG: ribosome silencing factor [Ignavibacteriae bacterium]|nr:ribosome silencing factor [Ignavibacteriota bacterium]MCB0723663.1 ribosome silencing factor [Ignavibacteriota bacterium]MCB9244292.1 ribosome silencing factor [Ignavibacteriales bacterium]
MKGKELAEKIAQLMLDKKGEDVKIFDIRDITTVVDYFVICSASSDTQVRAIANHIKDETGKMGEKPWHNEGLNNLSWVLMDYVNVVVHIFLNETRRFYNLEGLWADAEIIEVKDEAEIK